MLSTELQDQLVQLVAVVLAGVVAWVLKNVRDLVQKQAKVADAKLTEQQRNALYPALQYAIAYGQSTLQADVQGQLLTSDKLKSHVINEAVTYTRQKVPGLLTELQITDEALREMLRARLQTALDYLKVPASK